MIVSENCIALACLLLAASRLDAWAIVVNPRLSPRELDQIRDHSGARRVLFYRGRFAGGRCPRVALWRERVQDVGPLSASACPRSTRIPRRAGRGGGARAGRGTDLHFGHNRHAERRHADPSKICCSAPRRPRHLRSMTPADVQYCVLPISHIVGISLLIMTLMVGATVRLVSQIRSGGAGEGDGRGGHHHPQRRARDLSAPARVQGGSPGLPKLDRGALRLIAVAGAPLDLDLKSRVEQELGLPLLNGYGITECSPGNFRRPARCAARRPGGRHAAAGHRSQDHWPRRRDRSRTARSANSMFAGRT